MPQFLVMRENKPTEVTTILECTEHMVNGEKKNVELVMPFFKSNADNFAPKNNYRQVLF